jgi:quinol monooxygenase YgiN
MIGVTAKLPIQPGKEAEFQTAFSELTRQVRDNEAGCLQYELFREAGTANYIVFERYTDKAALDAHGQTDYFLAAQPVLGGLLAGAPVIEVFESV